MAKRQLGRLAIVFGACSALTIGAFGVPGAGADARTSVPDAFTQPAKKRACSAEKKILKKAEANTAEAEDTGTVKEYKRALKVEHSAAEDLADCKQEGSATTGKVRREPINKSTANPFAVAGTVGQDQPVTPVVVDGPTAVDPSQVGLYGGTMDYQQCDKEQLKTFLTQNQDKGTAWAEVRGITFQELPSYIDKLTPVLLRSDTRVTNHSFKNGKATPLQSVLQAGTAVLVDEYGEVVTKCYCGNPLKPPSYTPPYYPPTYQGTTTTQYYEEPPHYGPKWPEWTPTNITVIEVTVRVEIRIFVLVDSKTGQTFNRPAGTDGTSDTPTNTQSTPRKQSSPTPTPTTTTTYPRYTTTTMDPHCYYLDPMDPDSLVCA